ncbi:MAG: hypothetical protein R2855_12570 [Thermomicrobiales bacterium]
MTDIDRYLASLKNPANEDPAITWTSSRRRLLDFRFASWEYSGGVIGYGHYHWPTDASEHGRILHDRSQ